MNRKHELFLIDLGLQTLLNQMVGKPSKKEKKERKPKTRKWTKAQHEKYAETMKKKWEQKRKSQ